MRDHVSCYKRRDARQLCDARFARSCASSIRCTSSSFLPLLADRPRDFRMSASSGMVRLRSASAVYTMLRPLPPSPATVTRHSLTCGVPGRTSEQRHAQAAGSRSACRQKSCCGTAAGMQRAAVHLRGPLRNCCVWHPPSLLASALRACPCLRPWLVCPCLRPRPYFSSGAGCV